MSVLTVLEELIKLPGMPLQAIEEYKSRILHIKEQEEAWEKAYAVCEKRGHKWSAPHPDGRDCGAHCTRCGSPEC